MTRFDNIAYDLSKKVVKEATIKTYTTKHKKYYNENKDKINARRRQLRIEKKKPTTYGEYHKRYYKANKEKIQEYQKQYREKQKSKVIINESQ